MGTSGHKVEHKIISMSQYDLLAPITDQRRNNFSKAEGAEFLNEHGERIIDLNEMCIVLGQDNKDYIKAMTEALCGITSGKQGFSKAKERLYEYLMETTDHAFSGIHLTASGSEAVEWAVKLAMEMTGRKEAISFWNSIHGRTQLSSSLSGLPKRKAGYSPICPGIIFAPYPNCSHCPINKDIRNCGFACIDFLGQKYKYESSQDAAAVIVEPYQGAEIVVPPVGYIKALYQWAKSEKMMFIVDEIQSGMGRSGEMYCYKNEDIQPDMLLLGKALGNGIHISALMVKDKPDRSLLPALSGGVGDDFLACTAACEVFRQLEGGLLEHIRDVGEVLNTRLKAMEKYDCVMETRGKGLASAIEFKDAECCASICEKVKSGGFLIGKNSKNIILKPPYVVTEEQVMKFINILEKAIIETEAKHMNKAVI